MDRQTQNERAMVSRDGEVIAVMEDGALTVAELHCDEFAIVGYALLAQGSV
jgi:hypothetical protein